MVTLPAPPEVAASLDKAWPWSANPSAAIGPAGPGRRPNRTDGARAEPAEREDRPERGAQAGSEGGRGFGGRPPSPRHPIATSSLFMGIVWVFGCWGVSRNNRLETFHNGRF